MPSREPLSLSLAGKVLMEAQQEEAAIPYLERALSLDPTNLRARLDLAWIYTFSRKDYVRSATEIDEAERIAQATGNSAMLAEIAIARETLVALQEIAQLPARFGSIRTALR